MIMRYVAFLRGINVGGNKLIKMDDLKKMFGSWGFENVKTLLASRNVIFDAPKGPAPALAGKIEEKLKKVLGYEVKIMVRNVEDIQQLVDANPFKGIAVTPETRLYVTFLADKPKSKLKIPYATPEKDFRILRVTESEVCSVMIVSPDKNTTDLMKILEKEYGKNVTTRNWNTVLKILKI